MPPLEDADALTRPKHQETLPKEVTDLQDHPIFFFQIQFIYLFFNGKLLLLQHKSCYIIHIMYILDCQYASHCCYFSFRRVSSCYNFKKSKKK